MGDIIYSLPTVQAFGGGVFWVRKQNHYDSLHALLEVQPCITEVITNPSEPEKLSRINLDTFRKMERRAFRRGTFKHLAEYHLEAHKKEAGLDLPWLYNIEPKSVGEVVVNRSMRYHDRELIDWKLLEGQDVVFVGWKREYEQFLFLLDGKIIYYKCEDAFDMARVIKGSKLFLGNQSLGFALAEAMKHPRILEVYYQNANCMPNGMDGYTYLDEDLLDAYL
jgi:hypothetical protein